MRKILSIVILMLLSIGMSAQLSDAKHIILIGFDGLGSYAIPDAEMPHLKEMMNNGSYTLKARSVLPSSSAVNWASMLMGAGPTFHGYTEWGSKKPEIPSIQKTDYGKFPSLFSLVRQQRPKAKTAVIYSWGGIGYLIEKEAIDYVVPTEDDESLTLESAIQVIKTHQPLFTFIHFDEPDVTGHNIGHNTPAYYEKLKTIDDYLGKIKTAVAEAGMENETIIIVTSDHGGIDKGHGGKTLEEVEIPWIISGPGIKNGKNLESVVITYDTAATIAFILGLKAPQSWRGKAIKEVFN